MINTQTVLVLGAGSSKEVGLPTGDELCDQIAAHLNIRFKGYEQVSGDALICEALKFLTQGRANLKLADYVHACRRISGAVGLTTSIDTFIDMHRADEQLRVCGKLAIVRCILAAEQASSMYPPFGLAGPIEDPQLRQSWFVAFAKLLFSGLDESSSKGSSKMSPSSTLTTTGA